MPNWLVLRQARRKRIWSHEIKDRCWSNHSNRIKWPWIIWFRLRSSAHSLSKHSFHSRLFSVKSSKPPEWNCMKKNSSKKSKDKKSNTKREGTQNFLKPKSCKPKNSELKKSQKDEICNFKSLMTEKPGLKRSWSVEFFQNSTWKISKITQTEFCRNRDSSDNLLRPNFTKFILHGCMSRFFKNWNQMKTTEMKSLTWQLRPKRIWKMKLKSSLKSKKIEGMRSFIRGKSKLGWEKRKSNNWEGKRKNKRPRWGLNKKLWRMGSNRLKERPLHDKGWKFYIFASVCICFVRVDQILNLNKSKYQTISEFELQFWCKEPFSGSAGSYRRLLDSTVDWTFIFKGLDCSVNICIWGWHDGIFALDLVVMGWSLIKLEWMVGTSCLLSVCWNSVCSGR